MDISKHTHPQRLERYSFLWSLARLIFAALALLTGGTPIVTRILPFGLVNNIIILTWMISGLASGYLIFRWFKKGQKLYGTKKPLDLIPFFIMIVSGFNLGIAGFFGTNPGMLIIRNNYVFVLVSLIYIVTTVYNFKRWMSNDEKLF